MKRPVLCAKMLNPLRYWHMPLENQELFCFAVLQFHTSKQFLPLKKRALKEYDLNF